jgi:hypothetical protein
MSCSVTLIISICVVFSKDKDDFFLQEIIWHCSLKKNNCGKIKKKITAFSPPTPAEVN